MSSNNSSRDNNNNNNEVSDELSNPDDEEESDEEEQVEEWSDADRELFAAMDDSNDERMRQAVRNGAKISRVHFGWTILMLACDHGFDEAVRILLDAGADAQFMHSDDRSAMFAAIHSGFVSTVEILLNHDNSLLEIASDKYGGTPLMAAINHRRHTVAHLLLDRGANALAITKDGLTTLLYACQRLGNMAVLRRLIAAGVEVEASDECQRTALHHAAIQCNRDVVRGLIVEHNANMFAVDKLGKTPFDTAVSSDHHVRNRRNALIIECYGNKLTAEHGRLALHAILGAAEYLHDENYYAFFLPPLMNLRIRLPLGVLTLQHFRSFVQSFEAEMVRTRDDSGKLPIHIACRTKASVEVLALVLERDAATLQMTDYTGALPLHECCCGVVDYSSVHFLVEQGGVGTLAARNHHGAMPLHVLCGSINPSLRTVQYMIQSFSGSVAAQTNAGQYPFMIAACESSTASLSVIYKLARTNPELVVPK